MKGLLNKAQEFGLPIIIVCGFSRFLRKLKVIPKKVIDDYVNWKNRYVSNWLWGKFGNDVIHQNSDELSDEGYTFVFWWQGIENAPDIVKACIDSIRKHSVGRNFVILNSNNYSQYVSCPPPSN